MGWMIMSNIEQYYNKILSGEAVVGRLLRLHIKKLVEIIHDPNYTFDTTESDKRIKFIENECRHIENDFAGRKFKLELWQKAFIESVFAFYKYNIRLGKLVRKHKENTLIVGKKNGKTPFISAVILADWCCGDMGKKAFIGSNDFEQANLSYATIQSMIIMSPKLRKVLNAGDRKITFGSSRKPIMKGKFSNLNRGVIQKMSAKGGSKDGRNISTGVVDEFWEMKDSETVMYIKQGMSSIQDPLYIEISTNGTVDEGYFDTRIAQLTSYVKGELDGDHLNPWLYMQDSEEEVWQDSNSWFKSNPNLGISKTWDYLETMMEEAKTNSETRALMLAKEFNIKQNSTASWLEIGVIENDVTFELSEFTGSFYCGGNDFMETTDLCCGSFLFKKRDDPMIYLHQHFWIPESKLSLSNDEESGADYIKWRDEGWLTIVKEDMVDSSLVADYAFKLFEEYDIKPFKSGYDNRFAKDYINRHEAIFGKGLTENVPQDAKCLSNPMRHTEANMRGKKINYQNNPITKWCFKNCGIKLDTLGRCMPAKSKRTKRIDAVAGALCSVHIFDSYKSEFMSLIEL